MVPAYKNTTNAATGPLDFLLINLTNWPGNPVYPYAFVQVSALAQRAGLSIQRWDGLGLNREQQLWCISDLVQQHQPLAVGFTIRQADSTEANEYLGTKAESMPRWFPLEDTQAAIERIREISSAKIFVGGFTFTVNPVSAAKYLKPDFGIIGEPDDLIAHFYEVMEGRREGIANLLYYHDGTWHQNERVYYGPLDDIEYTPEIIDEICRFHGERLLRETHLSPVPGLNTAHDTGRAIAVEISRGCPCHCAFCCEPLVKGRSLRLRDLDVVEAEVRNLLGFGLRYFWFVCSELTFTKKHVMELAERLIHINRTLEQPIYWRAYFLPVKFNKDEFRILLRSGLMLEQNGPFSDLSNETLKQMYEPYRVKHALQHVRDLIELNEEPEFAYRKMERWILWSWLANPYSTRETVRQTLKALSELGLDLHFDFAAGYPALRIYEGLTNLPEDAHQRAEIVTGDTQTAKSIIHPAFYYSRDLLDHFGSIDQLHDFLFYAHETLVSKHYRVTRDWIGWSLMQAPAQIEKLLEPVKPESVDMPSWVDHPDLGDHDPRHWCQPAYQCWEAAGRDWKRFCTDIEGRGTAIVNAMVAALLHQGFVYACESWEELFADLDLLDEKKGSLLCSPYLISVRLMPRFQEEQVLYSYVEKHFSDQAVFLLKYYVYALNLRLRPVLTFLALESAQYNEPLNAQPLLWKQN